QGEQLIGENGSPGQSTQLDKETEQLLNQLRELDEKAPRGTSPGPNAEIVQYQLRRAAILEQIAGRAKAEEREQWLRQAADCFRAASQASSAGDKAAYDRLLRMKEEIEKKHPSTALAAYVTYREMQADYSMQLSQQKETMKVQNYWLERLAKFVQDYPKAD